MNSYLLQNKDKLHLNKEDLFDRIINLKLTVQKHGETDREEFIIRSDYEAVFKNQSIMKTLSKGFFLDNDYYIRKCTYKPSIKFNYTRVSSDTNIEMDIYVTNFLIFSSDGKVMATFNKSDYDLIKVEIMMGYWGQFKDMPHQYLEQLFKFEPMFGADKIEMNYVEYVTTDSLPPDYVLHIHGFVANVTAPPNDEDTPETFNEAVQSEQKIDTDDTESINRKSDLEVIFENQITKRFTRIATGYTEEGYKYQVQTWEGVKVFLSAGAKAIKLRGLRDKDGNIIKRRTYFKQGESLGNAMAVLIQKVAPRAGLAYKMRNDGNIEVFLLSETNDIAGMAKEGLVDHNNVFERVYENKLPAVYNIDVDETATIVCPFFAFIDPFQEVQFEYRYHTSNLVTYYASTSTERTTFIAINLQVSFATVDNINEMQIYCVTA